MSKRLILVEDHDDARELLASSLRRLGWNVTAFETGESAIESFAVEAAEVLVCDIVLPGIDGISVIAQAAEMHLAMLRVVITSFGDKEHIKAALNAGAHHLIEKPFTGRELHETLERLIDNREEDSDELMISLFQRRLNALPLNADERQLVTWVLKGLPNRSIALLTDSSEQQVKNRLHRIYQKNGIASRSELFHLLFPI